MGRFPVPPGDGREEPFGVEPVSGQLALGGDHVPAVEGPQKGDAVLRHALLPLAAGHHRQSVRRRGDPQLYPLFAAAGRDLREYPRLGEGGRCRGRKTQCGRVAAARRAQYPPPLSRSGDPDPRYDGACLRRVVRLVPADVRLSERTAQFRVREPAPQGELGSQTAPPDGLFRGGHAAARHPHHGRRRPDEPEQDAAQYPRGGLPHGLPQAQGQPGASRR